MHTTTSKIIRIKKGGAHINRVAIVSETSPKYLAMLRNLKRRDWILWHIMLRSGLRISDAIGITRMQLLGGAPVVSHKTGKPTTLDLPADLIDAATAYMRPTDVYVFASRDPRRRGKPISRQTAEAAIAKAARRAGLRRINAHSARCMYAAALWQQCHDLPTVQRALQHDNPGTTALYLLRDNADPYGNPL